MKYVFKDYLWQCILVFVLILTGVIANVQGTMFTKNLIDDYITPFLLTDSPDFGPLAQAIGRVAVFYAVGVVATYLYNRIMVNVTQGTLRNLRNELFEHMETLPIKYFDTHAHGDIMSVYTNDIDTLRQMISQSIPQIINSGITIISVFISMLILNIPLTVITMMRHSGRWRSKRISTFGLAFILIARTISSQSRFTSTSRSVKSNVPASIFDKSRISLMSCSNKVLLFSMMLTYSCFSSSSSVDANIPEKPTIEFNWARI